MYTKEDITPEIRDQYRQLLAYIKIKVEYRRTDLIRKLNNNWLVQMKYKLTITSHSYI